MHYTRSQVLLFTQPPLYPLVSLSDGSLDFPPNSRMGPEHLCCMLSHETFSQLKPGRTMENKAHLQMENYMFNCNRNTRSQTGSLNHWVCTSSAEKKSRPLKHLGLRFKTLEIETLRGKGPTKTFHPALRSQLRVGEGSFHHCPHNTKERNVSKETIGQSVQILGEGRKCRENICFVF